jgi:hypothetical protein
VTPCRDKQARGRHSVGGGDDSFMSHFDSGGADPLPGQSSGNYDTDTDTEHSHSHPGSPTPRGQAGQAEEEEEEEAPSPVASLVAAAPQPLAFLRPRPQGNNHHNNPPDPHDTTATTMATVSRVSLTQVHTLSLCLSPLVCCRGCRGGQALRWASVYVCVCVGQALSESRESFPGRKRSSTVAPAAPQTVRGPG